MAEDWQLPGGPSPAILAAAREWATIVGPDLQRALDAYADRVLARFRARVYSTSAHRFADRPSGPTPAEAAAAPAAAARVSTSLIVTEADWTEALRSVGITTTLEDAYAPVITTATAETSHVLGVVIGPPDPAIAAKAHAREIQSWAPGFAHDVGEVVATGVRDGLPSDEIAANLASSIRGVNGARGVNIARTEANAAQNAGRTAVADASGHAYERAWSAVPDGRVRFDHAWANGQIRGNGKPFTVGGWSCMYPGDPRLPAEQRARCRCTTSLVFGRFDRAEMADARTAWGDRLRTIAAEDGMVVSPEIAALLG